MFKIPVNFKRRFNREKVYFSNQFSNLVHNKQYEYYQKVQNFSSLPLKIMPAGPKLHIGTWVVNTNINKSFI